MRVSKNSPLSSSFSGRTFQPGKQQHSSPAVVELTTPHPSTTGSATKDWHSIISQGLARPEVKSRSTSTTMTSSSLSQRITSSSTSRECSQSYDDTLYQKQRSRVLVTMIVNQSHGNQLSQDVFGPLTETKQGSPQVTRSCSTTASPGERARRQQDVVSSKDSSLSHCEGGQHNWSLTVQSTSHVELGSDSTSKEEPVEPNKTNSPPIPPSPKKGNRSQTAPKRTATAARPQLTTAHPPSKKEYGPSLFQQSSSHLNKDRSTFAKQDRIIFEEAKKAFARGQWHEIEEYRKKIHGRTTKGELMIEAIKCHVMAATKCDNVTRFNELLGKAARLKGLAIQNNLLDPLQKNRANEYVNINFAAVRQSVI